MNSIARFLHSKYTILVCMQWTTSLLCKVDKFQLYLKKAGHWPWFSNLRWRVHFGLLIPKYTYSGLSLVFFFHTCPITKVMTILFLVISTNSCIHVTAFTMLRNLWRHLLSLSLYICTNSEITREPSQFTVTL